MSDYHTRQACRLGALTAVTRMVLDYLEGRDALLSRTTVLYMLRGALEHDGSDDFWSRRR